MLKESAVAVVFGGDSAERDVSIITGTLCANLLKTSRPVIPVFIDVDKRAYTSEEMFSPNTFKNINAHSFTRVTFADGAIYAFPKKRKSGGFLKEKLTAICGVECILNCCHGGECEGGAIAAMASAQHIPLASPDMYSSAIAMDKSIAKSAASECGVPIIDGFTILRDGFSEEELFSLAKGKYPLIVKPARAGSSIGVSVAADEAELISAVNSALRLGGKAAIERYIGDKADVSCAVYEDEKGISVSPAIITYSGGGIYAFDKKYSEEKGGEDKILSGETGEKIREYSARIYKRFGFSGMIRTDFILSGDCAYFCEVNSVPGSLCYGFFTKRFSVQRNILEGIISFEISRFFSDGNKKIISDILNKNKKISLSCCKLS